MNTDNMSILGLTIDYGPYGWLDDYDPDWTPNTTDAAGRRYRFGHQAAVAQWNLLQLANALYVVVDDAPALEQSLQDFQRHQVRGWQETLAAKLGLGTFDPGADAALFDELDAVLRLLETDMTLFFRRLAEVEPTAAADEIPVPLRSAYYQPERLDGDVRRRILSWLDAYRARVRRDGRPHDERRAAMNAVNPRYVLRNYLAQLAIDDAEAGDYGLIRELLDLLRRPYDEQPERERYAALRPDWARTRVGCSQLSCSS
jgi:uncharacterized protein YdiU (UPF0061 family)